MSTANLGLPYLVAAESQKTVQVNTDLDAIDGAIAGVFVQAMADADQTPSTANAMANNVIECTGALTADRHLILPNTKKGYWINNLTTGGHNIVVKTSGSGSTFSVASGKSFTYCDGANNFK